MTTYQGARVAARRLLLAALAMSILTGGTARGDEDAVAAAPIPRDTQQRALKQLERDLLRLGARRSMTAARERLRERRGRRAGRARTAAGAHAGPVGVAEERVAPPPDLERFAPPASLTGALAVPVNVRVNSTVGDTADAGQAEESVAALGNCVLVAWNDGQGFRRPWTDTQTAGYSTDGGATFTKVSILHPAGWSAWRWTSDPVVTVNEKTGTFFYCGMADANSTTGAIGVAAGHFSGGSFAWDLATVVRTAPKATMLLDKPWCVADSATGNVYVTYTTFDATDHIDFHRSADGGATWSSAMKISLDVEDGDVQGSRPAVGPGGEVYVAWMALGPGYGNYFRVRASDDGGLTWNLPNLVSVHYAQYGTGAPGYNREKGVTFPSLAVDRTRGPTRGRLFVAWNETWNSQATPFTVNTGKVEVESNNYAAAATPFTPGQTLRGQLSSASPSDFDWWQCPLTAGQSLVVWVDSLSNSMTYTCRLFAPSPDSLQRLCFGGQLPPAQTVPTQTFFSFTAPVSGTYRLRMAPATTASAVGRYRIETALGAGPGAYRARDQRDVFVAWSGDGGNSWSSPARVNDDPTGFDDWLPEVALGPDGVPYVFWFDFRDDTYGSRANCYISRSLDGGATWQPSRRLTSATGNFTTCLSNLMPNQGDYNHLVGDARYLRLTWADARGANVDVWATSLDTWFTLTGCPGDREVDRSQVVSLSWTAGNPDPLFANDYRYSMSNSLGWPVPAPGTLAGVPAGGTGTLTLQVAVPDTANLGPSTFRLTLTNDMNTLARTCDVTFNVTGPLGVEPGTTPLAFLPVRPNPVTGPAHVRFTLPSECRVTLRLYDVHGGLVRTLADGWRSAGVNEVVWDGRDAAGRPVAAGAYFVRLDALGRTLNRRIVRMR